MKPKYSIIGVGSVGSMIAYYLNSMGVTPYLVFRDRGRIREIYVANRSLRKKIPLKGIPSHISSDEWIDSDIAIIDVKSYDIEKIIDHLKKLKEESLIISIQNGFGCYSSCIICYFS
jgi:ketopantoate reductase